MNRSREEYDALTPAERAARLSRAGVPALGITLRVDREGEVLARGNHVMEGYWAQPDATADAIPALYFAGDGDWLAVLVNVTASDAINASGGLS